MPAGVLFKELHANLVYLDGLGNLVLNTKGNLVEQIAQGNMPGFITIGVGTAVNITAAAGAANIADVSFHMRDGAGNAVAGVFTFDVYLSDAASGAGLTATTASGTVQAATSGGVIIATNVAKKSFSIQTNASGIFILEITDTAKTHFYPVAALGGAVTVGAPLTTGNYG